MKRINFSRGTHTSSRPIKKYGGKMASICKKWRLVPLRCLSQRRIEKENKQVGDNYGQE